jgi:hypothetical protein
LCREGRLCIHEDTISGGAWHYCLGCKHYGDLIELAAAVWGVDVSSAVIMLSKRGIPLLDKSSNAAIGEHELENYIESHVQYRQRMHALWQRAKTYLHESQSATLSHLRQFFSLHSMLSLERWRNGPGRLFGALPCGEVELCFCPLATGTGGRRRVQDTYTNPSRARVFRGFGWDEVLVFPYYDLPERICGFLFVGRDGTHKDLVFRRSRLDSSIVDHVREAGLSGLDCLDMARSRFGTNVIALEDPVLMTRIQIRNYDISTIALPLVAWYDDFHSRTQSAWRMLAGRTLIFWSWKLNHRVLYQAMKTNGLLVLAGPEELTAKDISHYLRLCSPADMVKKLIRNAKPWKEVFSDWVNQNTDAVVEELLIRLQAYKVDLYALAETCKQKVAARIDRLLNVEPPERSFRFNNKYTVIEKDGCWYIRYGIKTSLLMNAILRVDDIVTKDGRTRYYGRALYQGEEIEFNVSGTEAKRCMFNWLHKLLATRGKTLLVYNAWGSKLLTVALAFQEPRCRVEKA